MTHSLKADVLLKLDALDQRIADLRKHLPYADGQAYYNDVRESTRMEAEKRELLKDLETFTGQDLPKG